MRAAHIFRVLTGDAGALPDKREQSRAVETARELNMAAIDDIGKRADPSSVSEFDRNRPLEINIRHEFAAAQVDESGFRLLLFDAIRDAATTAASVEAEDEARPIWRAAMNMRIYAERPVIASRQGDPAFHVLKTGAPHQRPVSKNPHPAARSVNSNSRGTSAGDDPQARAAFKTDRRRL